MSVTIPLYRLIVVVVTKLFDLYSLNLVKTLSFKFFALYSFMC